MTQMDGKVGVIFGIANSRSYAWHIARALLAEGAQVAYAHLPGEKNERRVRLALKELDVHDPLLISCDVSRDEDLDATFDVLADQFGRLDFVLHSVAMADKRFLEVGRFHETPRHVWTQALDISVYSLIGIANRAAPLMNEGGSIVSLSYFGGEKVVPGYNVMGVAKAALEHTTRYLALELGRRNIRVNCISGGPLRTLSAMGVGNIETMLDHQERFAPLQRNIDGDDVGKAAMFLLSDLSSALTGEVMHVDAGFNILACIPCESLPMRDLSPLQATINTPT